MADQGDKESKATKTKSSPNEKKGLDTSLSTLLSDADLSLFNEGNHFKLYEKFGAHPMTVANVEGTYFAVWAPNARRVSVVGDFNNWGDYTAIKQQLAFRIQQQYPYVPSVSVWNVLAIIAALLASGVAVHRRALSSR